MKIATRKACPQRRGETGKINPIFQKLGLVTIAVNSIVSAIAFATPATASTFNFSEKFTAPDGDASDLFGLSVAIDRNFALIGSGLIDDNGTDSGSAYLFDITNGELLSKLTAPDIAAGDRFGHSVAIDGDRALIGAFADDDKGFRSGSAYLFDITSSELLRKLTAPDGTVGDAFGISVAIDGDYALIGSIFSDGNVTNSGAAYLFNVTNGELLHKFTAPDGAAFDEFNSVAIDGNFALIGSRFDDDKGDRSGSAYLFDITNGELLHKLTAPDGTFGDEFGFSVAIDGDFALIGAHAHDPSFAGPDGAAYLFDVTSGELLHKLTIEGFGNEQFGWSVAIDGDLALIGSINDDDGIDSGAAYLFDIASGELLQKIKAPDSAAGDIFGLSVAINGDSALIGSPLDDDNGTNSGSAYLFTTEKVPEPSSVLSLLAIGTLVTLKRFLGKQK